MTLIPAAATPARPDANPGASRTIAGTALGAVGIAAVIVGFAALLHLTAPQSPRIGPVFSGWAEAVDQSPLTALRWLVGDMTEPLFYKSELAATGLLVGALIAWWAGRRRCRWAGDLSYGTGLWPWVMASAALSLLISNAAFGWMLDGGWQPTFVPFVCVAPAVVLVHGPGWKTCLTGAVLGAATTTPLAVLLVPLLSDPLGLPSSVANVAAMSIGTAVSFLVILRMPGLVGTTQIAAREVGKTPGLLASGDPLPAGGTLEAAAKPGPPTSCLSFRNEALWAARRVLKDFTETFFLANEVAGIGVILGVAAAFVLNPALPAYGSNLVPHILCAQAIASAVGVVLWRGWFRNDGWAATYAPVVSVAPAAVLAFNGSWAAIIGGAFLGALLAPPLARLIASWLPSGFHPVIGNTAAMAISTAVVLPVLELLPH
ncbi:hypothetical protein ACIPWF_06630 [Paenarthrobacter sp. NPDC089989]|uniref:hypothetical protein n=1 Tax=unclassified Paenarthrobacter TaxID=2634190 RepID=UPI00380F5F6D